MGICKGNLGCDYPYKILSLNYENLPVNELNVCEKVRNLVLTPKRNCISAVKLWLTVNLVWLPVCNHAIRNHIDENEAEAIKHIFKQFAEASSMFNHFLNKDHSLEA